MIDAPKVIKEYLLEQSGVVAVAGERIHAERDRPPVNYKPSDGPCIVFKMRGGSVHYSDALLMASAQFKCYGATEVEANEAYRALYDALQSAHGGTLRWAQCEVLGQTLAEPDTGWPFVLVFFQIWLANS